MLDSIKDLPKQADKTDRLSSDLAALKSKLYSHYGESVNQPVVGVPLKKKKPAPGVETAVDPSRILRVEKEAKDLRSIVRNLSAEISALRIKTTPPNSQTILGKPKHTGVQ